MPSGSNTDLGRLDISAAVDAILTPAASDAAPKEEEVTGKVSASEAAITADNAQDDPVQEEVGRSKRKDPDDEPKAEEPEESEEDDQEEEPEDDTEGDDEEEEPEETPDEEDEEDPDDTEEVMYTTQDGEQVTLDELKKGYLRQSDYTKKTQAVAQARDQLQSVAQQVQQERQVLAENLNLALNVIEPQLAQLAKTDWDKLAAEDAYEYAEKRALFDQAQARYNQIVASAKQAIQAQQAQTSANHQARFQNELKALSMALPDMADPTKARQLRSALKEYAISAIGLTEQEANQIVDHRMVVMMNKARLYDELQDSQVSVAKKKVAKTPKKVVRAGKPTTRSERQESARKQQQAKLRKSGSVDDAVALLLGNM